MQFWRGVFWAWNGKLVKNSNFGYQEVVNSKVVDQWQRKPFRQVMIWHMEWKERVNQKIVYKQSVTEMKDYCKAGASIPPWVVEANLPPDGPRRGSWHDTCIIPITSIGVSEREEMIKAPIIINPRIEEARWKSWTIWNISLQSLSTNLAVVKVVHQYTGEALLKICQPAPKLHTTTQHITPTLKKLHWLPIKQRIDYKICLLTYKTLTYQQPTYLYNSLSFPSHSVSTRSSDSLVLSIPIIPIIPVRSSLGKRAFSVIGPRLWNSLPPDTRNSSSLPIFRSRLKTHLFKITFPP